LDSSSDEKFGATGEAQATAIAFPSIRSAHYRTLGRPRFWRFSARMTTVLACRGAAREMRCANRAGEFRREF